MRDPAAPYAGGGLFLDRDGTLNVDIHHLHEPDRLQLIDGTREALQQARRLGFRLFLFTNQSGINRGLFKRADAEACNRRLVELIDLGTSLFDAVCIAPETPDEASLYRKPSPRFIHECLTRFHLLQERCYMVGDRGSDWQAGVNAGIHAIGVRSGKPMDPAAAALARDLGVPLFDSLHAWIQQLATPPHTQA